MCSINLMIKIIYQDKSLLVINKPSGINCIPDGYDPTIPHLRSLLEPEFGRLWIVHRLDKETSGIVLLARSADSHRSLNIQFTDRKIKKQYTALIFGNFIDFLSIEAPLLINGDRRHRTVINQEKGKPAKTEIHLNQFFNEKSSEIDAFPFTGYTHQIRSHLFSAGFPILSDPLYNTPESNEYSRLLPIQHTALHAKSITFTHPESNQYLRLEAEPPEEYLDTVNYLKQKGAS